MLLLLSKLTNICFNQSRKKVHLLRQQIEKRYSYKLITYKLITFF